LEFPIVAHIKGNNDFKHLRSFAASVSHPNPLFYPYNVSHASFLASLAPVASSPLASDPTPGQHPHSRILRLHSRYQSGATDPSKIIARVLDAIKASNSAQPPLRSFLSACANATADAEASTARWKAGKPLGLLDGVPVGIKVEFEVLGETHSQGTQFITRVADKDAEPVARLRAAGAIIVGITNMHEIGIGTSGHNPWTGSARNPYNISHLTGGSSSGSGSAVSAGIVPISLGADGGGSIRIPAALCGVIGLKPTFGRVPCDADLAFTVGHAGRTPFSFSSRTVSFFIAFLIVLQPSPPVWKMLASCAQRVLVCFGIP
jgi:Asp-tRNA(Asn)/Glu-tRNA(Gln) amidotransferase A subunit family amidase